MSDRSKRLRKLEGLVQEPQPKQNDGLRVERWERRMKICNVRQARRKKWLARATKDQLVIGLSRVDRLEETDLRLWDRKVSEELDAAAREQRRPGPWARDHSGLTKAIHDGYREKIVGRLLEDRRVEKTEKECWDLVKGARADSGAAVNAELILAAIETTVTAQLRHAEIRGTA